jgi:hypothetical protein
MGALLEYLDRGSGHGEGRFAQSQHPDPASRPKLYPPEAGGERRAGSRRSDSSGVEIGQQGTGARG